LNLGGWYCPLTHLETHLRRLAGPESTPYAGSFWVHYLERIIYLDLPARTIRIGEILFACLNLMVYGICFKRFFIRLRKKPRACPWMNV
jgi:hypothetical protein